MTQVLSIVPDSFFFPEPLPPPTLLPQVGPNVYCSPLSVPVFSSPTYKWKHAHLVYYWFRFQWWWKSHHTELALRTLPRPHTKPREEDRPKVRSQPLRRWRRGFSKGGVGGGVLELAKVGEWLSSPTPTPAHSQEAAAFGSPVPSPYQVSCAPITPCNGS